MKILWFSLTSGVADVVAVTTLSFPLSASTLSPFAATGAASRTSPGETLAGVETAYSELGHSLTIALMQ